MHIETLEVQVLEQWILKLRKHDTYNRKWWPSIAEAKEILRLVRHENPRWVIEFGTGNGVVASFIAAAGFEVLTFDPVDRPKIYEDESFPLKKLPKSIHAMHHYTEDYGMNYWVNDGKTVWFIDVGMGEKTRNLIKKHISTHSKPGDMIIERGQYSYMDTVRV